MVFIMQKLQTHKKIVSYLKHTGMYEEGKESAVMLKIMIDDKIIKNQGVRTRSQIKMKLLFWLQKPRKTAGRKF